jgi:conjugal transfer pilus assembly protein TraW
MVQDIKDHKGQTIVKAGTVLNPLNHVSWGQPLLFLNGEDPAQITWAKRHAQTAKWILTQGKPLQLEEELQKRIYFDQGGKLIERFKIQQLPARVSQEKLRLLVEEIKI